MRSIYKEHQRLRGATRGALASGFKERSRVNVRPVRFGAFPRAQNPRSDDYFRQECEFALSGGRSGDAGGDADEHRDRDGNGTFV